MNKLYLVIPSNLKNPNDFIRMAKSIDISEDIKVYFINQSDDLSVNQIYSFHKCELLEVRTGGVIPLSAARNLALDIIYKEQNENVQNSLIMFVDDDAWFPKEALDYLLSCEIRAYSLHTIDPVLNKSFSLAAQSKGRIRGWHLIHDIVSICLVVPLKNLTDCKIRFNERLGLGNMISQGEESLFIYHLQRNGMEFYYNEHFIYHPYKKTFNIKNFYSLSYFWTWGFTHVSSMFAWPCIKYILKYTVALVLVPKDIRYFDIFKSVWRGAFDGLVNRFDITA